MICENCGAKFDDNLTKCPYCGSMNRSGAYKDFRHKLSSFIDKVIGLKEEIYTSLSSLIIKSVLRSIIIVLVCLLLGFILVNFTRIGTYDYFEEDVRTYEDIVWENDNIEKLNNAYENNDLDLIEKLENDNYRVVRNWSHYSSYYLNNIYNQINSNLDYQIEQCLYFLYNPNYFVNFDKMDEIELDNYNNQCELLYKSLQNKGYSKDKLKYFYDSCSDDYGYLDYKKLQDLMEANND